MRKSSKIASISLEHLRHSSFDSISSDIPAPIASGKGVPHNISNDPLIEDYMYITFNTPRSIHEFALNYLAGIVDVVVFKLISKYLKH